jgi:hypothetical protein
VGPNFLSPADDILAVDLDGNSTYPGNESPEEAIDGQLTKYLNFGQVNSGFIVTPDIGSTTVTSFRVTTANDAEERDPSAWSLSGTNQPITSTDNSTGTEEAWQLIDSGTLNLPAARNTQGPTISISNLAAYTSYRMIFTDLKGITTANSIQFAEVEFFEDGSVSGSPPSLQMESIDSGQPFLRMEGAASGTQSLTMPRCLTTRRFVSLSMLGHVLWCFLSQISW